VAGSLTDESLEEDGLAMARAPAPGHTARTVAIGNYPRRGEVATWPNSETRPSAQLAGWVSSRLGLMRWNVFREVLMSSILKISCPGQVKLTNSSAGRPHSGDMSYVFPPGPTKIYSAAMGAFPTTPVLILVVISAGLAQMVAGAVCQNVLKFVPFGRNAMVELNTSKTFRKLDTIGMAYVAGFAPFVSSFMFVCAYWILDCKPPVTPLFAAQIFWIIGAGHGIVIEHASIKYSVDVAAYFLAVTYINAAVMGWVVEYIYKKHHWGP